MAFGILVIILLVIVSLGCTDSSENNEKEEATPKSVTFVIESDYEDYIEVDIVVYDNKESYELYYTTVLFSSKQTKSTKGSIKTGCSEYAFGVSTYDLSGDELDTDVFTATALKSNYQVRIFSSGDVMWVR